VTAESSLGHIPLFIFIKKSLWNVNDGVRWPICDNTDLA